MPDEMIQTVIKVPEPRYHTAWVECTPKATQLGRVVEWEYHDQHPTGSAYLCPGPARLVALTPLIVSHIQNGMLTVAAEPDETLEEYLYRTDTHDDAAGDFRHIAKAPPVPKSEKAGPRLKATMGPQAALPPGMALGAG